MARLVVALSPLRLALLMAKSRNVIVMKTDRRVSSYYTGMMTVGDRKFPLFGTRERKDATVITEKEALKMLDAWRKLERAEANKVQLLSAS